MPKAAWEDLSVFLRADDFAVAAQLMRGGVLVRSFTGIFDEPSTDAALGAFSHDTTAPTITATEADLAGATKRDEIVIDGRTFDVMEAPEVDGTGMAKLRIMAQPRQGGR